MPDREDLMERIARAGARVDPGLSDEDVDRLVRGASSRSGRRAVRHGAAAMVVLGASVAGALLLRGTTVPIRDGAGTAQPSVRSTPAEPQPSVRSTAAEPQPSVRPTRAAPGASTRFADGSVATPLDGSGALTVLEDAANRIAVDLPRGRARFDVVPNRDRSFSVRAGDVTVTVVGTAFTVERIADRVGVSVERGVVRVDWGVGSRQLRLGESGWFPPLVVGGLVRAPEPRSRRAHGASATSVNARAEDASTSGRADGARTAADLLSAADAARVAGQADEAADLLRLLLRSHRRDPRAPLAAFTLGRVLMIELDRPREAAAAFAEARALAPRGPFAEDAEAREAEAFDKAGDAANARARALDYLERYPNGRRAEAMRALGGK
jgi:transmembrane sensor